MFWEMLHRSAETGLKSAFRTEEPEVPRVQGPCSVLAASTALSTQEHAVSEHDEEPTTGVFVCRHKMACCKLVEFAAGWVL